MPDVQRLPICMILVGLLLVISLMVPVTPLKHNNMICSRVQDCVCGFPTGEGINLTSLGQAPLIFNDTIHSAVFYFNPCVTTLTECLNNSVVCVNDEKSNHTTPLGLKNEALFKAQGLYNPIYIYFKVEGIETDIQLECSEKNTSFIAVNRSDGLEPFSPVVKYHFLLQSPAACLQSVDIDVRDSNVNEGMSSGAAFFIVLLVLVCLYFLIGAAANHFIRGASGWEMIPNYGFWKSLPNTLLDGIKYVANGCRPPPSYEQI